MSHTKEHSDDLVQDCSISIANALEILQSCTKPSMHSMQDLSCQDHIFLAEHVTY